MRISCSRSLRACLIILVTALATVPKLQSYPQKTGDLKVAVDLVLLDVSVQDKNGQPVHDLKQQDFRVYEDKVEQPIASFSAEESPVTWGLVLDRSSSMTAMMKDVYES